MYECPCILQGNLKQSAKLTVEGDPEAEIEEGITTIRKRSSFPASLTASRGPIAAPQVPLDGADTSVFPNNVVFVTVRRSWNRCQV